MQELLRVGEKGYVTWKLKLQTEVWNHLVKIILLATVLHDLIRINYDLFFILPISLIHNARSVKVDKWAIDYHQQSGMFKPCLVQIDKHEMITSTS